MKFAPEEIVELYRGNLADQRASLAADADPSSAAGRSRLRRARKAAEAKTRSQVGADAWRCYRDAMTRLGAPEFVDGVMKRQAGDGSYRVDALMPSQAGETVTRE